MSLKYIAITFLLSLIFTIIIIPIIIKIAHKNELFDSIDHRKIHVGNIPRLGGIGFILATVFSYYILCLKLQITVDNYIIFAVCIIFMTGVIDDLITIKPVFKLLSQIIAITIVVYFRDFTLSNILVPYTDFYFNFGIFKYILTVLWIIGISNAINLLDGMDGQAGGVSYIAAMFIGISAMIFKEYTIAIINFSLAGSLFGFLIFNLPPAKIFMGDSGSLTIGFILAIQPLMFSSPESKGKMILVTIAVLLVPILDVFTAIIRRTRLKISFFEPDRGHIHHKFLDYTSLSVKKTLVVVYLFVLMSGILAILYIKYTGILTTTGLFLNLFIHIWLFIFLHKRKKERS